MTPDTKQLARKLALISAVAVLAILVVVGLYVLSFHGAFSQDRAVWGQFGDYLGGTLNPVLSFFAFLALLFTILIQHEALQLSREELRLTREELAKTADAAQRQAAYFEREANRTDLYRLIETLAARINRNYNEDRLEKGNSLHRVFSAGTDVNEHPLFRGLYENFQVDGSLSRRTIKWIESDLRRLASFLGEYERISAGPEDRNSQTPLPGFYRTEFGVMVDAFRRHNMIGEDIHGFYCASQSSS